MAIADSATEFVTIQSQNVTIIVVCLIAVQVIVMPVRQSLHSIVLEVQNQILVAVSSSSGEYDFN